MDTYLGDGLYAKTENGQVVLYASNGVYACDTVYLEPEVLREFLRWLKENKIIS